MTQKIKAVRNNSNAPPRDLAIIVVVSAAVGSLSQVLLGRLGWLTALGLMAALFALTFVWQFPEFSRQYGFGIAFLVFAVTASILNGSHAKLGFYEAAAQVIPVLFLALAVEARFSIIGKTDTDTYLRLTIIFALGVGEFTSLAALASENPGGETFALVAGALMAAAVAVVIFAVTRGLDGQDAEAEKET